MTPTEYENKVISALEQVNELLRKIEARGQKGDPDESEVDYLRGKIALLEKRWADACADIAKGHYVGTFKIRGSCLDFMIVGGKVYG